jgi:hypothetical protein
LLLVAINASPVTLAQVEPEDRPEIARIDADAIAAGNRQVVE